MSTAATITEEIKEDTEVDLDNAMEEAVPVEGSAEVSPHAITMERGTTARRSVTYVRKKDAGPLTTPRKNKERQEPHTLQIATSQAPQPKDLQLS
jgi:hypothetical protein